MFCNKCGNNIESEMKFCNKCGASIKTDKPITIPSLPIDTVSSKKDIEILSSLLNRRNMAVLGILVVVLTSFFIAKNIITQNRIAAQRIQDEEARMLREEEERKFQEVVTQNEVKIQKCLDGFLRAMEDFDQSEMTRYLSIKSATEINDTIDFVTLFIPAKYLKLLNGVPATKAILSSLGLFPSFSNTGIVIDFSPTREDVDSDFEYTVVPAFTDLTVEILDSRIDFAMAFEVVKIDGAWQINKITVNQP